MNTTAMLDFLNVFLLALTVIASASAARSASKAAKSGDESFKHLRESSYRDSRAYISIESISTKIYRMDEGDERVGGVKLSCNFMNHGRTPSFSTEGYYFIYSDDGKGDPIVCEKHISHDIGPNASYTLSAELIGNRRDDLWTSMKNDKLAGVMIGFILQYRDY